MRIDYAKASTTEQNLGLQHDDLEPALDASVDPTEARKWRKRPAKVIFARRRSLTVESSSLQATPGRMVLHSKDRCIESDACAQVARSENKLNQTCYSNGSVSPAPGYTPGIRVRQESSRIRPLECLNVDFLHLQIYMYGGSSGARPTGEPPSRWASLRSTHPTRWGAFARVGPTTPKQMYPSLLRSM
jgi:hypothetical protein